ncbi:MAG: hypothetical protein K6D38_10110 [Pseudobutyrivibrio sp.]|nr:hypothetical protein [Pseudobutyrivibrio sp.]
MKYDIERIFDDYTFLGNVHTKAQYEDNTKLFLEKRYSGLKELVEASDVASECQKFCQDVFETYKKFGKVRGRVQMNLNYFMIYYVFPSILTNEENGKDICDALKDAWNQNFKCNINYTDYNTLYDGFQMKIFGIPIGKN